jgi:NAD(P)-dependent dehydrogenase (short-subunit alcohol dehydrogenase family)
MAEITLDFSGKAVVVTGGSRGLGKDIAIAFASKGARVAICGRKQENLDLALGELRNQGLDVMAHMANVGNAADMEAFFGAVEDRYGRLDVLINNVGMNILTPQVADADEGLWDKVIQTNLKGPFLASKEAVKIMKKGGSGKIVNITSIAARKASMGMGIYGVAKAGVEMLTKVLAAELAGAKINVNAVAPCMVKTKFSQPFWGNEDLAKQITKTIPLGRIAETEDVVGVVLFLASGLSDFVTGEIVNVDGGSMVW